MATKIKAKPLRAALRELALTYPGAHEDFPWGESVIKVKGKIFVFLGRDEEAPQSFGLKLPGSGDLALSLPFITPAGYGLGKSGWVMVKLGPGDDVPFDLLREWLDESYRAVAPKKLSATLTPLTAAPAPKLGAKAKPAAKPKPQGFAWTKSRRISPLTGAYSAPPEFAAGEAPWRSNPRMSNRQRPR
jgi:predicted DNA-binding protein (MmcQ/YjbR family)